ncbi:hypothetical protein V8E55_002708 [Tylopilus felleus]
MIYLFVVFLHLSQVVRGTSLNTTSTTCPQLDGVSYRSVWSILGTCALTLLICVWRSIHVNVPSLGEEWYRAWGRKGLFVVVSFFVPESVVADATQEWWKADKEGCEWSMTHSFFAEMGGFVYHQPDGNERRVDSVEFLELCKKNQIANPTITVEDIRDRSKSDALGKAILAIQLLWFTLQVVVRVPQRLTITLVELDTVCMAVLTLLLLLIWKDKPLRPERPHFFYSPQEVNASPGMDLATFEQFLEVEVAGFSILSLLSFCVTGVIFGGLHLAAWNFAFATDVEKKVWRVASLILAGAPLVMIILCLTLTPGRRQESTRGSGRTWVYLGIALILLSRLILLGLMFASLRSVPCSAHQSVTWTLYIPHL